MIQLNILVLATGDNEKLVETIEGRGHKCTVAHPHDFDIHLSSSVHGYDSLYLNGEKVKASDFDACISRIGADTEFGGKVLRQLRKMKVFCVQSDDAIDTCADKFKSAQIMSGEHIRVPKQFYTRNPEHAKTLIEKIGGLPAILKELWGSKGKGLIELESARQTNMTLQSYLGGKRRILLQEFIDNGGHDERHIVVDGRVVNSMERQSPDDDIRANLSLNGTGRAITPDPETEKMCIDAVKAIPNLNFAGVDIMKKIDKEGNPVPYFIEINSNPGDMIIDVTGINHYEALLDFVERNCNRKQSGSSDYAMLDALKEAVYETPQYKALAAKRMELFPDIYRNYRERGLL